MRAAQVVTLTGPADVVVNDVPAPEPEDGKVLIRVEAVGVAFPDLLLSRGEYQMKPEPPFTVGADLAGTVISGGGFEPGTRVCGCTGWGGAQEQVLADPSCVFPIPDSITFEQAAAIPMNYLTADFALFERGGLQPGETVLVHGAAGGLGTAVIQVAKGMGATVIGVASTEEKRALVLECGADHAIGLEGFKDAARELTGGRGVDVVADIVGGDIFTDSLRCLARQGRLIVLGFAAQQGIPSVKVNRLLFTNTDIRGAAWGEYWMANPGYMQEQWKRLEPMLGVAVQPPVGRTYSLAETGQALDDMDQRRALGKLVVRVRD